MAYYRYTPAVRKKPVVGNILLTVQEGDKIFQLADGTGPRGGKCYFLLWGTGTDLTTQSIQTPSGSAVRSQSVATHYVMSAVRAARNMEFRRTK